MNVLGIEYGAEAYFIFEKTIQDLSTAEETYGNMKLAINIIPKIQISGHGSVEMNEEITQSVKELHVKFHGDFVLSSNPTTFEEAVKIYKNLSALVLGEKAQTVPMKVYLYPLKKIDDSKIFAVVRDISESLVSDLIEIMQDLEDAIEDAEELIEGIASKPLYYFSTKNI